MGALSRRWAGFRENGQLFGLAGAFLRRRELLNRFRALTTVKSVRGARQGSHLRRRAPDSDTNVLSAWKSSHFGCRAPSGPTKPPSAINSSVERYKTENSWGS